MAGQPAADGRGGGVRGPIRHRRPGGRRRGGAVTNVPPVGAHRAARLAAGGRARRCVGSAAVGQAHRARNEPRRIRDFRAFVVDVRAGGRHAVHPGRAVDPELGDRLHGGRGRNLVVHGPAHHVPGPSVGARELRLHHDAGARVLRAPARPDDGDDRGIRGPRSFPVLRDVGGDAHSDVLHHRSVGRGAPHLRSHQVLPVHLLGLAAHAGGDPRTRIPRGPAHRCVLVRVRAPDGAHRRTRVRRIRAVRRVLPRVRDQGADVPVPHLAPRCPCRGPHGGVGAARGSAPQDGHLRLPAVRAAALPGGRGPSGGTAGHRGALADRHPVRRPRGDGPARLQETDRLLVGGAPRLRDARHLGVDAAERPGRAAGDDQPRHLDRRAVLPRRHAVRAAAFAADRGVRWDREGRADAGGGADDRLAFIDRPAGHQRVRRGVPGAARGVPDVPPGGHHRHRRRDRRGDVSAPGAAARDVQPARQACEREARGPVVARDRGARAVAGLHRVDRRVPQTHPPTDGAERAAAHPVGPAQRGLGHGGPVSLDLANSRDLLRALLPELALTLVGMVLLLVIAWRHRTTADLRAAGWLALAGLAVAGAAAWWLWWHTARAIGAPAMIAVDDFRFVADGLLLGTAGLTVLVSFDYLERERLLAPEYYALLLFATLGTMLMVGGEDLMVVFLGLELMSVAVYALAGINRHSAAAAEAALKYFLLGAFASGFLLYGIALVYGATATTNLSQIGVQVRTLGLEHSPLLLIGLGLLLVGFGFKVAAVPFHMWAPDVYDGSPTPVTGYMATAVKAAAFAAVFRVLGEAFGAVPAWREIVWWLAVITMLVGNFVALAQRTLKRMLAYSSVAHAGYVLVAVAAGTPAGAAAFVFYLVAYTFMTLAAFALLA